MRIKREKLLDDLHTFTSRGNGVIIGSPGVGKTFLLKELCRSLDDAGMPYLYLPVDELGNGTEESLRSELSYDGDLIEWLKSVPATDNNATLFFDAFDAARNEETRQRFLRLIRRAIQELKGLWNVIVTVRTYDARKSQEFLDLFGDTREDDLTNYHIEGIMCRHLAIPHLTPEEIWQAFDQIPHLESIYESATQDLKSLLTNPFNLWLLEKILSLTHAIPDLSQIYSEVQLLDLFWQRRIGATDNEDDRNYVLTILTRRMVGERSLSVRQEHVYETLVLDKSPASRSHIDRAWNELLSDEILAKVSSTGKRIAFTHNILFDYAIGLLLIEDEPGHLEAFVLEDPSRPLFLRPSLTYFFTRLWYHSPDRFWEIFWRIFPSDQFVQLRLFARLIPTSVIANEAREVSQIEPLLEKLQGGERIAVEAMVRLLQAYRMLSVERDAFWIEFFDCVSRYIQTDFVWDMASLSADILERAREAGLPGIVATCGIIGRRSLRWVLREREGNIENDWFNQFAGTCAVPLVVNTYGTKIEKSRILLRQILALVQQRNFPINPLLGLTMNIDEIWPHDPEFVLSVYCTVFSHYETSEETTDILSGSVLSLTSTRRGDYKSCQFRLIRHFSNFLRARPLIAIRGGIRSLNYFIAAEHIARNVKEGETIEDLAETFTFHGETAYYIEDDSYIWDESNFPDEPIEMADELFQFIEELAHRKDSHSLLDSLLAVFREEVRVALFWKRLLKTATKFPDTFGPRLYELCMARSVLIGKSSIFELGRFLEVAAPTYTPEQLRKIEDVIVTLPLQASGANSLRDDLVRRRDQLLARIPHGLLQSKEGRRIRERMERTGQVPENRPLFSFESSSNPYSEEEWLQDRGVDTTKPQNQSLQRFFGPLDSFESEWRNSDDGPTEKAIVAILPVLKNAYTKITGPTGSDKEVIDSTLRMVAACVVILSRVAHKYPNDLLTFCRRVLLHCAVHELPKPNPAIDAQFDIPAYSPFPRHEATEGLALLISHDCDQELLYAIEALAIDPVPSVRMILAKHLSAVYTKSPQDYWRIVGNMAARETNVVVLDYIHYSLIKVVALGQKEDEKITGVMAPMFRRNLQRNKSFMPSDSFTTLIMWLAVNRENSWACETMRGVFLKNPVRYGHFLTQAVYEATKYLNPVRLNSPLRRSEVEQAIIWLEEIVGVATAGVQQLCETYEDRWTDASEKKLRDTYAIIDKTIARLYFNVAYESEQNKQQNIPDDLLCQFYVNIKPLLRRVLDFAQSDHGIVFAPTAHQFMELLRTFLSCNPREVLHFAECVARSSQKTGYNLDSLAVAEVVRFVEVVLADHRKEVREGQALEDLVNLLDIFAEVGWTEALRVVWRLDEVFR